MRHPMPAAIFLVVSAISCCPAEARQPDPLCAPLKAFVASVKDDEEQSITFRTNWGGGFSDEAKDGQEFIAAKRCEPASGPAPALAACRALMEEGAMEFSDANFRRVVTCLSPKTKFAPRVSIAHASYEFTVGDDNAGAFVTIEYAPDEKIGGMAMRILVEGY